MKKTWRRKELAKIIRKNRKVDEELLEKSLSSLRKLRRAGISVRTGYNLTRPFSRRSRLAEGTTLVAEYKLRSVR